MTTSRLRTILTGMALLTIPAALGAQPGSGWTVEAHTGPTRNLAFEATRGTWMSLTVSPDGQSLAFDLLGAIYELPIGGGTARRLTDGRSWNLFPRYSPDGRWIAFSSDRSGSFNVWIMDRQGGNLRRLPAAEIENAYKPGWSADGKRIYAGVGGDGVAAQLVAFHVGGGRQTLVRGGGPMGPVGEPGGTGVWYERNERPLYPFGFNPYVIPLGGARIERYDERTGEVQIIIERTGGAFSPALSPNGDQLAYLNRSMEETVLIVRDLGSRAERVLLRGVDHDRQEGFGDYGPHPNVAWHPDGRRLFIATGGDIRSIDVVTGQATVVPFRAPVAREMSTTLRFPTTEPRDRARTRVHRFGVPTPRGVVAEALGDLWLVTGQGTPTPITKTPGHETAPAFDPASGALYYAGWRDDSLGAVYRMASIGASAERLTSVPAQYGAIAVAPEGGSIAFARSAGGVERGILLSNEYRFDLMLRTSDGRERRITGLDGQPLEYANIAGKQPPSIRFAPSGERLYFTEFERDTLTLKRIDNDGGNEVALIRFPHAVSAVVSPDLAWVVYREYNRSFLTPLTDASQTSLVSAFDGIGTSHRVDPEDGGYLAWSADSRTVHWTRAAGFFAKTVDRIVADAGQPRNSGPREAWNGPRVPGSTAERIELSVEYPIARPQGAIALTNARVVTMNPGRDVIRRATVVVQDGRITAVGNGVAIPPGATRLDLAGKTIIPGLIDAHAHPHIEHSPLHVIEQQPTYLSGPLAYGVTSVFEVYGNEYRDGWLSDMLRAGTIAGPRFFTTGSVIYGQRRGARLRMYRPIETLDDALEQLRWNKDHGATAVKDYAQEVRKRRHLTLTAARILGLNVVSESSGDPQMNFTQLMDGVTGIEHSMGLFPFYDDVVKYWGGTGAGMTPTLLVVYNGKMGEGWYHQGRKLWEDPKLTRFVTPDQLMRVRNPTHLWPEDMAAWKMVADLKKLYTNGTSLQVGAHGQMFGLDTHWELDLLVKGGFTPAQALEMGTIRGAAHHGLDGDLGSVEVGKAADLVVLDGDPLVDIGNALKIHRVMKNGILYDGVAGRIWPDQSPAPRPYFVRAP